jgi:glycosyltransferase involved in cell wall biosynthesis
VDLYDPIPLEAAELFRGSPLGVRRATHAEAAASLRLDLARADLVLCASGRQQELWHGAMVAAGLVTPELYDRDPALTRHVRVVPFGVPSGVPQRGAVPRLRGAHPGIGENDELALWAGGLHDWFDPELAVRAVAILLDRHPRLRLVFMGADPPNPRLQPHAAAARARAAAEELGLLDRHVFFRAGWVPYMERGELLAEADLGVSCHRDTAETRYAWRTRLLDYLWAELPVACTSGDVLGDLIAGRGAGVAVSPGDLTGFAGAMHALLGEAASARARSAARDLAEEFRWARVVTPLLEWVENPIRSGGNPYPFTARLQLARMLAAKTGQVLRTEGLAGVLRRAGRYRDT